MVMLQDRSKADSFLICSKFSALQRESQVELECSTLTCTMRLKAGRRTHSSSPLSRPRFLSASISRVFCSSQDFSRSPDGHRGSRPGFSGLELD